MQLHHGRFSVSSPHLGVASTVQVALYHRLQFDEEQTAHISASDAPSAVPLATRPELLDRHAPKAGQVLKSTQHGTQDSAHCRKHPRPIDCPSRSCCRHFLVKALRHPSFTHQLHFDMDGTITRHHDYIDRPISPLCSLSLPTTNIAKTRLPKPRNEKPNRRKLSHTNRTASITNLKDHMPMPNNHLPLRPHAQNAPSHPAVSFPAAASSTTLTELPNDLSGVRAGIRMCNFI